MQTNRNIYIVVQSVENGQLSVFPERTIPFPSVKYVSASRFRDDWFAIGIGSPQEPDPLVNCLLKTEFFTHLKNAMKGTLNLKIADQ